MAHKRPKEPNFGRIIIDFHDLSRLNNLKIITKAILPIA